MQINAFVNILKVYIKRNNLQLELQNVDFIQRMDSIQYHPPNAYQEVSNTNHFGSVSPFRGQCMASTLQ